MNLFRRNPKRLPGTLCDETAVAGKWQPAISVHEVPEPRDDGEYDRTQAVAEFIADMRHVQPVEGPVAAYLRHLLAEITDDRDKLSAANGLLVAKIRELEARSA